MNKLIIPKGCVFQGDISAISNDGDIEIHGALTPSVLHSGSGGIKFITPAAAQCDKIVAEQGVVEIESSELSCKQIKAQSLHLKTGPLTVAGEIQVEGELFMSCEEGQLTHCQAGLANISGKDLRAQSITCSGELTLQANHAKVDSINARKVVISGDLECKRIVAQEGILVESGKMAIKSVECPSFHASPEVTGIVMVANCDEVRAEGVRGFLHPSELGLLSDEDGVVSIPTADLTAMAMASDEESAQESPDTAEALSPPPDPAPVALDEVPPVAVEPVEDLEPEETTVEEEEFTELPAIDEPEMTVEDDEDTNPEPEPAMGGTILMTAALDDEEGTVELSHEDLADDEDVFGITAPIGQHEELDVPVDDTDVLSAADALGEVEDLDPVDEMSVEDPLETDELGDLGEVAEALDEADELHSEDLEVMDSELVAEEAPPLPPDQENPADTLVRDLTTILDEIRSYFPQDNIPNSISQIQRYIDEGRFNLFAKSRNKEAVLSNFDKFEHETISRLVRSFFTRVEHYVDANVV